MHSQPNLYANAEAKDFTQKLNGSSTKPVLQPTPKGLPQSNRSFVNEFEAPVDSVHDGAERIAGFVVPPVTGLYVFKLSSGDAGRLYLNKDGRDASKAEVVAEVAAFLGKPGKSDGTSTFLSTRDYMPERWKRESSNKQTSASRSGHRMLHQWPRGKPPRTRLAKIVLL